MKLWKLAGTTAVVALFAGSSAFADVTPEDVWQSWQDLSATSGGTITTGSVARDGDTLVVTDLKSTVDNAGTKSESAIAELRFTDLGDGTVEVTMSDEMTMSSTTAGVDGGPAMGMTGTIKMPGAVTIVSGTPEESSYAFTIPTVEMTLDPTENGAPAGKITLMVADVTSNYLLSGPADAKEIESDFAAASAAINIEVTDATGGVKGSVNVADLSGELSGLFAGIENEDFSKALAAGFALDSSLAYGAASYDFDITDESGPSKLTGGSEGGSFQLLMDAAQLMLSAGGKNVAMTLSSAQLPFPEVKLSYAESGFTLAMPVSKSDEPADFALLAKIVDLSVSEEIWGMLDPTGAVPHDPATVVIDTKGKARLTTDIMDEAAMAALGDAPPGEIHALDLNELHVKIAGADLTGAGSFTFDNSDLATYGGAPAPTGKVDLKLVGGNTLLDKLVAMGMLTEDDAMGARMMMSMFANPGAGADELTSTLEFKDKHFYANGQQLQ